jgi:O-antigen ligase
VVIGHDAADARRRAAAIDTAAFGAPPSLKGWTPPPRSDLWRAAWTMFRERPWLGRGPDSFRWVYGQYLGLDWWDRRSYANNLVLELLATTGLLGLTAFGAVGAILWTLTRRALRHPRDTPAWRGSIAAATALLAVFAIHGLADYFLEFTAVSAPFWTAAGVVAGLAHRTEG